jgi:hypothetical protein
MLLSELRRTPVVITQLLWKPFSVRYDNFLKKLEFHRTVMEDEETLVQTKTLFQVKKSQDAELHLADEHRQRHGEYQNLVHAVEQKVPAAEFSEYLLYQLVLLNLQLTKLS